MTLRCGRTISIRNGSSLGWRRAISNQPPNHRRQLVKTRYTYGGDEHIYVEMDDEMSLDAFFKSLSMSNAVREAKIEGVTEICPANASFQVRFDPDVIAPEAMMKKVQELEHKAEDAEQRLKTRIIEIPVYYQDPWTHETLMRFREP